MAFTAYRKPNVYTRTLYDPRSVNLAGLERLMVLIGEGRETFLQEDIPIIRGSSAFLDIPVVQDISNQVDGTVDEFTLDWGPLVKGDGNHTLANSVFDIVVSVNYEKVVPIQVDAALRTFILPIIPEEDAHVEVEYFYSRVDQQIVNEELTSQIGAIDPVSAFYVDLKPIVEGDGAGVPAIEPRFVQVTVDTLDGSGKRPMSVLSVDGELGKITLASELPNSPDIPFGSKLYVTYFTNQWRNTWDHLPNENVSDVIRCGNIPLQVQYQEEEDFVVSDGKIFWGNAFNIRPYVHTPGAVSFGENKVSASMSNVWMLDQATRLDPGGGETSIGDGYERTWYVDYSFMEEPTWNGVVVVDPQAKPTFDPSQVEVYVGTDPRSAHAAGARIVESIDPSALTFTLAEDEGAPLGAPDNEKVFIFYRTNFLADADYEFECLDNGEPGGTGNYAVNVVSSGVPLPRLWLKGEDNTDLLVTGGTAPGSIALGDWSVLHPNFQNPGNGVVFPHSVPNMWAVPGLAIDEEITITFDFPDYPYSVPQYKSVRDALSVVGGDPGQSTMWNGGDVDADILNKTFTVVVKAGGINFGWSAVTNTGVTSNGGNNDLNVVAEDPEIPGSNQWTGGNPGNNITRKTFTVEIDLGLTTFTWSSEDNLGNPGAGASGVTIEAGDLLLEEGVSIYFDDIGGIDRITADTWEFDVTTVLTPSSPITFTHTQTSIAMDTGPILLEEQVWVEFDMLVMSGGDWETDDQWEFTVSVVQTPDSVVTFTQVEATGPDDLNMVEPAVNYAGIRMWRIEVEIATDAGPDTINVTFRENLTDDATVPDPVMGLTASDDPDIPVEVGVDGIELYFTSAAHHVIGDKWQFTVSPSAVEYTVTSDQTEGTIGVGQLVQTFYSLETGTFFTFISTDAMKHPTGYAVDGVSLAEYPIIQFAGGDFFKIQVDATNPVYYAAGAQTVYYNMPGMNFSVQDMYGMPVGDSALLSTYHRQGQEPSVSDLYYLTYEYPKAEVDLDPQVFTKIEDIIRLYGDITPRNPVAMAAHLGFQNGAAAIGIVQVPRATNSEYGSISGYQEAIDKLKKPLPGGLNADLLIPLRYDDSIAEYLELHCDVMSSDRYRSERVCYLGFSDGITPDRAREKVSNFTNNKVTFIYPDRYVISLEDDQGFERESLVSGVYAAAAYGGRQTSPVYDAAEPMTRKLIVGFTRWGRKLDQVQMDQLATAGITILEDNDPRITIRHGLTSDNRSILLREQNIIWIVHWTQRQCRRALDIFIGTKYLNRVNSDIEAKMKSFLQGAVDAEILTAFRNIEANADEADPTQANVSCEILPVFALNYIMVTFSLRTRF